MIADIPGHRKLRRSYEDLDSQPRGVVFFVDSTDANKRISAIAEYLHDILIYLCEECDFRGALMIACSKADELVSLSPARIRMMLEKEM